MMTITAVYTDKRYPNEPYAFTTKSDGFVEVHRFEDKDSAERTHKKLRELFGAQEV